MKKAFSMIELIFIILLIGILAKIGSGFIPDNKLLNDTHYIVMKIKEAQKNAIGYDDFNFSNPKYWDINRSDYNRTCITCNKDFFEKLEGKILYIDNNVSPANAKICFDSYGRPYDENGTLMRQKSVIKVSYKQQYKTISVFPITGYATIE